MHVCLTSSLIHQEWARSFSDDYDPFWPLSVNGPDYNARRARSEKFFSFPLL
jgi:hypothetical protein